MEPSSPFLRYGRWADVGVPRSSPYYYMKFSMITQDEAEYVDFMSATRLQGFICRTDCSKCKVVLVCSDAAPMRSTRRAKCHFKQNPPSRAVLRSLRFAGQARLPLFFAPCSLYLCVIDYRVAVIAAVLAVARYVAVAPLPCVRCKSARCLCNSLRCRCK